MRFTDRAAPDGGPLHPALPSTIPDGVALGTPLPSTMFWLRERLHAEFEDLAEYGGGAANRDRTRYMIRWHGDVPAKMRQIVDEYADRDFEIVIEQTAFLPGDLRAEAGRLLRVHSPVVQGAGPRPAGDGVDVTLSPEAVRAAGSAEAALADNGVVSDYPIFVVSVGDVEPA
jgi:hypothetical protein